ncbi:DEAD/DEAH box helicase [Eleftheria terrae]|uniref:DEAD/DEAH box helicase n=1 Tax=Eleftheria terrae TaxID=1597781 RepID=UPI00263B541D|nr:DEAD/DEAH box helicase [Eleftheria terrae]WKB55513.1 DEAD/DEAH box helicase [Eleftheria terrae]
MPFASLGLSSALLHAVDARGYEQPTAIQQAAIPAILRGTDLLALASTGSGKTAAFALPLLQQLQDRPQQLPRPTHALVLVPTRDLAIQVGDSMRELARQLERPVKLAAVYGGVSINPQMMALRGGADVVVATPGRLLDLVQHNALKLADLKVLVLDEADRLLEAGFADELQRVLALLPARRQTLLFSATYPATVQGLAQAVLNEPLRLEMPGGTQTPAAIEQRAVQVDAARRTPLLRHLLEQQGWSRVLVFVASKYATEHVAQKLRAGGIAAAAFHGDLSQGARSHVLADFKAGRLAVVVATDVAARGLDIAGLPVVVNYDLPRSPQDHVHRIGRTGRAGQAGLAVSFVSATTEAHFRLIEKRQGQRVPREVVAGFEPTEAAAPPAGNGGIKGKRKSKKDKLREAAARDGSH